MHVWTKTNHLQQIPDIYWQVGKDGERECIDVYPRCILYLPEMLEILRRQGISFDIPGEERDCQIYFLWKKKDKKKKLLDLVKEETAASSDEKEFDAPQDEN